ncbi:MAG: glycosyltransferase family 39 protein [Patescibacteria group bacterium]
MPGAKEKWILIIILAVAFVFRFQDIQLIPPGLYPDEAINGNNALIALETGDYKVFYPENNGREGLFINIQALFLKLFGAEPWVLRTVSATFGFLTVSGLYLLVRLLFNWQIASIASFYLAVSFWHVVFSRIGFRAIMVPFLMVWGFYFLWRGLRNFKFKNFALSGLIFGLGFHTYIAFRFVPFIIVLVLLTYWWRIKKDYGLDQYLELRNGFLRRFALFFLVAFFVALPILYYFWQNPNDFIGRGGQVSIFEAEEPIKEFFKSLGLTLASFNFTGDFNWRHNFSGSPLLFWLVGAFFIIGLLKSFAKCFKKWREHGHPAALHVLLLSWFSIMLLPSALTHEGIPHALRLIGVLPVVMIFAAEGTWWFFETLIHWYREKDIHPLESPYKKEAEGRLIIGAALIILLAAIGIVEYDKYFNQWAKRPEVQNAFSADFVEVGKQINQLPKEVPKYVVVNTDGILVDGIPMSAQTVMFITQTYTKKRQKEKNVFYILPEEEKFIKEKNAVILPLIKYD